MAIFRAWCAVALLAFACGCSRPQNTTEQPATRPASSTAPTPKPAIADVRLHTEGYPKNVDGRLVLATAPATADAKLSYEVSIGACTGGECPVQVSLVEGTRVLDKRDAEWSSTDRAVSPEKVESGWGVGDPGTPPGPVSAWTTGDQEKYLGTAARALQLAPGIIAILLDQRSGFEHIKRHHQLYLARDGKVERIWELGEGAGPAVTSTAIVPWKGDSQALVAFDGFRYPGNERADSMNVTVFGWNAASGKVEPQSGTGKVHAAVVPGFATVAAARQFRGSNMGCVGRFWVLPAAQFPITGQRGYVLAAPATSPDRASASVAEASKCAAARKPVVVTLP